MMYLNENKVKDMSTVARSMSYTCVEVDYRR